MITSGILEKITQSLDDLYRLVEQHADSNFFIHEVSINKKNLLKTMRELYTEHNNHLRNNQTLEETVDSLRKQLKEKEQAMKNIPTENSITKHFNDLNSRAAALESRLEGKIKDHSPLLQSLQKQMKQMDDELKKVSGLMEDLNEADSSKSAQIIQVNETTQTLQQWIEGLHQKIESLTLEQTEESRRNLENLFERVTESDQEVKGMLEKVHRFLETQPDVQKQFRQFEQQLSDLQKNLKIIERVEQPVLTPLNERMDQLEEILEQNQDSQLNNKIAKLTDRLEKLDQKVNHDIDKPDKSDEEIKSLSEKLTETDKKVDFIFDFLEKYLDHQEEAPNDFQQSLDGLTEKIQQLAEKINFTQEGLPEIKEETETSDQQEADHVVKEAEEPPKTNNSGEKQSHDLPPFHRLTAAKKQASQAQAEEGEQQASALNINNDNWFYHTLKNLPHTQGMPQPKRRPKKKRAKAAGKKEDQLKGNMSIAGQEESHGGKPPIRNEEEPKQSFIPDPPQGESDQIPSAEEKIEKEISPQTSSPRIEEGESPNFNSDQSLPQDKKTEILQNATEEILEAEDETTESEKLGEGEEREIEGETKAVIKKEEETGRDSASETEKLDTTENAQVLKEEQETPPNKKNIVESIIKMFSMT